MIRIFYRTLKTVIYYQSNECIIAGFFHFQIFKLPDLLQLVFQFFQIWNIIKMKFSQDSSIFQDK